jgi:ATP-dependent DNA helicase RecQ
VNIALEDLLITQFQMPEFRLGQKEIIGSVLAGKDVLAVLPTGGGKSLCYQYPAVMKGELVIVVSPLIALMKDQVASLTRMGIPAGCIHSGQSQAEKVAVFRDIKRGGPYVLYLSPERTVKEGFQAWIKQTKIALFAVDEAHCVSQWGHDFRAEYSQLKMLKTLRPDVPVLALTASATPFVLNDIAKQLGLKQPVRHVHGFYRPNLFYQVETCADDEEKLRFLRQAIRQNPEGRILIYCGTRRITEELCLVLEPEFSSVGHYHAGLGTAQRNDTQDSYSRGDTRILIATNAFGMGIDHPNVRLVVHFQMPANIDSLYQEMGRAGRDGEHSTCLMLYAKKDKGLQSFFITNSKAPPEIASSRWRSLENLVEYAEGGECRHSEILTYYQDAQRIEACGHCDVCDPSSARRITRPEVPIATVLRKTGRRQKPMPVSEILAEDDLRVFEILRMWRKEKARELKSGPARSVSSIKFTGSAPLKSNGSAVNCSTARCLPLNQKCPGRFPRAWFACAFARSRAWH